jgi:hypothetical protein
MLTVKVGQSSSNDTSTFSQYDPNYCGSYTDPHDPPPHTMISTCSKVSHETESPSKEAVPHLESASFRCTVIMRTPFVVHKVYHKRI